MPRSRASSGRVVVGSIGAGIVEKCASIRQRRCWSFGNYARTSKLAAYPIPNVTTVPSGTHHVHGRCVHCHKYTPTLNPTSIPTIAPR